MEQKKERKLSFIYKFKYLLHSTREYRKYAYLSIGFVLVETILECIIPYIMSRLISLLQSFIGVEVTETLKQEALNGVIIYGSILLVLGILSLICGILAGRMSAIASAGFAKNYVLMNLKKLRLILFITLINFHLHL